MCLTNVRVTHIYTYVKFPGALNFLCIYILHCALIKNTACGLNMDTVSAGISTLPSIDSAKDEIHHCARSTRDSAFSLVA